MAGDTENPWNRVERRLDYVERELDRRKDHAHELELEVRELCTRMSAMNDVLKNVLAGIKVSRDGITELTKRFDAHHIKDMERRITDTEARDKERRANRRFRITTVLSVLGVFVVVVQIYFQLIFHSGG